MKNIGSTICLKKLIHRSPIIAVISIKKQSEDGLESWLTDLHDLTAHTKLERLGSGNTSQTVTNPDGTKVVTNSNSGKVTAVQQINSDGTNGNLITYNYDEFNRQTGTVETFGTATVNTSSATYDNNGNILTQTVNGHIKELSELLSARINQLQ
ncbi:MAG: hypothetical protein J6W00_02965 [Lentisphaeria bacterium]|nr:hypothetical protein [Lentisphaeria bacterium]